MVIKNNVKEGNRKMRDILGFELQVLDKLDVIYAKLLDLEKRIKEIEKK